MLILDILASCSVEDGIVERWCNSFTFISLQYRWVKDALFSEIALKEFEKVVKEFYLRQMALLLKALI
jgi:hypothetical protein